MSDKPREWWLVFPHDPYREMKKVCNSESAAKNYGASESITHVIEYSAYESAKSDTDKTQAALDYVRQLLDEVTEERDEARADYEHCDKLFEERCEKLRSERARSAKLADVVRMFISYTRPEDCPTPHTKGIEALAEYEATE